MVTCDATSTALYASVPAAAWLGVLTIAQLAGSTSAARLGGPGLAGLVAQALSVVTALLFNAASFLVSAACLLGIRHRVPRPEANGRVTTLRADVAAGIRLVARDFYMRPMGVFGAVGNLALTGNQALAVVFLVRVVGLGPFAVGLLLAVPGAAGGVAALTSRRVTARFGTAR